MRVDYGDAFPHDEAQEMQFHFQHQRSRSSDHHKLESTPISKEQNNQIELRSVHLQNNQEMIKSFFKFYLQQVIADNEKLTQSYIDKLKESF